MVEPPGLTDGEPPRSVRAEGPRSVAIGGPNLGTINVGDVVPWFRSPRQQAAVGAMVLVLLLGASVAIYQFVRPLVQPAPPPPAPTAQPIMVGGAVKIAVGEFDGLDASGRPLDPIAARDLAITVTDSLKAASSGPNKLSSLIWSPDQTGSVAAGKARDRAREIKADIIVYATLRLTPDATHLQPRFYIAETKLNDAKELAGEYNLGEEIVGLENFVENGTTKQQLSDTLGKRVSALQDILAGLERYRTDQVADAAAAFERAYTNPSWKMDDGKEILFLFGGLTAGRLNDFQTAAKYLGAASRLERTRARAQLGRAELLLQQAGARDDCATHAVDVQTLHQAAVEFAAAAADPAAPAEANVDLKAHYGLGQINFCLSQSRREDRWADATREFETVASEYNARQGSAAQDVKNIAADAHAQLGFIAQPWADETDSNVRAAAYARAADEYRLALDISAEAHPLRRAYYAWALGLVEERQGQLDQAEAEYAHAVTWAALDAAAQERYQQDLDRLRKRHG